MGATAVGALGYIARKGSQAKDRPKSKGGQANARPNNKKKPTKSSPRD